MAGSATVWTRSLSDEFWSGGVTPLMFSVSGGLIERRMVGKSLRLAGIEKRADFLRYYRGYVYVNTEVLKDVFSVIPSIFLTDSVLGHLPAWLASEIGSERRSTLSILKPRFVMACARTLTQERGWSPFTNHKRFARHARAITARARRGHGDEIALAEPPALLRALERVENEMGDFLEGAIWGVGYAYLLFPLVRTVSERWLGESEGRVASWASGRIPGNKTVEVNESVSTLASMLRASPRLRERVRSDPFGPPGDEGLDAEERAFRVAFREMLARHGHRLLGRDLIYPAWHEEPETVMALVLKAAEGEGSVPERSGHEPPPELARRTRLWPFQRLMLELGLHYMPRYVNLREDMRYFADLYLERTRRIALALGEQLAAAGLLAEPREIFFLFEEEIAEAVRGERRDLVSLTERRRRAYEEAQAEKPPLNLRGDEAMEDARAPGADEASRLQGTGLSRGTVRGRARVVLDVRDFDAVEPGEILVTSATDPGWTSLFGVVGGLVMEMGGILSHGAILAREYGLPAVAHIPDATRRIADGTWLEVDGLSGTVRILEAPAAAQSSPDRAAG